MEQAINAYYTITASPEFQEIERLRAKARHDEAQALYHARQEGRLEGRQEGRLEEKSAVAKALLADGVPIGKVIQYTGMSQEELEAFV